MTCWWEVWESILRWTCHRTLCAFLYKHPPGDKGSLPQHSVHLHPLEVLEHTQVNQNVFRWVMYVLWLQKHPHSYHWYRKFEKERPHLVPSMFTLLFWYGLSWLQEAPRKKRKVNVSEKWLSKYRDVLTQASLGGVNRFAEAHKLPLKKAQRILERDLAYTLHNPEDVIFPPCPGWVGRSMGHRFGGSSTLGQVQPRGSVPDDGHGCPVQVRVGTTVES